MPGREMEPGLLHGPPGLVRPEHPVRCGRGVGAQTGQPMPHHGCRAGAGAHQPFRVVREVEVRRARRYLKQPPGPVRLERRSCPPSPTPSPSSFRRQPWSDCQATHRYSLLLKCDRHGARVAGLGGATEHVLHAPKKAVPGCAHAPLALPPRLQSVAARPPRIVAKSESCTPNAIARPVKCRSIQRPRPTGGCPGMHALALLNRMKGSQRRARRCSTRQRTASLSAPVPLQFKDVRSRPAPCKSQWLRGLDPGPPFRCHILARQVAITCSVDLPGMQLALNPRLNYPLPSKV